MKPQVFFFVFVESPTPEPLQLNLDLLAISYLWQELNHSVKSTC